MARFTIKNISELRVRTYQLLSVTVISLFYSIIINPFISFDGWQYISSATSLFNRAEMAEHYFWVREPIFPAIIKLFSLDGSFLWGVIVFNLLFFMISFFLCFIHAIKVFQVARKVENICLIVSYTISLTLIGGYAGNFGKDLMIISMNLLFVTLTIRVYGNETYLNSIRDKILLSVVVTFSSLLSLPLSFAFSVILTLLLYLAFLKNRWGLHMFDFLLILTTLILSVLLVPAVWQEEVKRAVNHPSFNKQNLLDPFWEVSTKSIVTRFSEDLVLVQTIPLALLSLLWLGSNLGWIFSRGDAQITPSQNADIGFGLFAEHYPQCNTSRPHGFIADPEYLKDIWTQELCGLSTLDLPNTLFYPVYGLYVLALFWFVFSLKKILIRDKAIKMTSYLGSAFLYICVFAFSGGAVDRYGSILIPLICIGMALVFGKKWSERVRYI